MKKTAALLTFLFLLSGCTENTRSESVGVVDLPVIVRYSAEILAEKNGRVLSKNELLEFVSNVTASVAKEKGCTVILNKTETVIYYNEDSDITADVITEINRRVLMNSKSGK
ncbi:MAG: OmpH family outer membrane protein [Spirochaetes bacterium]|nr:OmpH family outer membrane protein [Spirochaetota bacterium]